MRHAFKDKEIDAQHYNITAQSRIMRRTEDLSDSSSSDDNSADINHK